MGVLNQLITGGHHPVGILSWVRMTRIIPNKPGSTTNQKQCYVLMSHGQPRLPIFGDGNPPINRNYIHSVNKFHYWRNDHIPHTPCNLTMAHLLMLLTCCCYMILLYTYVRACMHPSIHPCMHACIIRCIHT